MDSDPENKMLKAKLVSLQSSSNLLRTWEANIPGFWKQNTPAAKRRLREVFSIYPDLQEVYDSVQEFHILSVQEISVLRKLDLSDWINKALASEVPELRAAANTINDWKDNIVHSYETGFSNGPCERINIVSCQATYKQYYIVLNSSTND